MTSLGLTALIAMVAAGGETYAEAHKETANTGRPLVVMVGADWCPACQVMKNTILPEMRSRGLLRRVAFALVNLDREHELGAQLTANGPIPQLLLFRRTADGWRMRRLIGGQDVQTVETFINEGVEANEAVRIAQSKSGAEPAAPAGASKPSASVQPAVGQAPKNPPVDHTADKGASAGNG